MKIIIAPDSFKGSLTAGEAAAAIERGVKKAFPDADTVLIPMADGGEGTMENLVGATGGRLVPVSVTGPLGQQVEAHYGVLGNQSACIIEVAAASGLGLISSQERNPMEATSYGTGQLIKAALDDGFRSFILALGGSATNDGGAGMMQALGLSLKDRNGKEIGYGGEELGRLHHISLKTLDSRLNECKFLIASDVDNPLVGETGASYVFGPQKGADEEMVKKLDQHLRHWADLVEAETGIRLHDKPGAGAAGGMGGASLAFFPVQFKRGIDVLLEFAKMDEALDGADLVITGEGQVDGQTAHGKTPMGVAQAAWKRKVPTLVLAGSVGEKAEALYPYGVIGVYSIINRPMTLEQAMEKAEELMEHSAEQVIRTFFRKNKAETGND